jgi:hypothetical protein
MKNKSLPQHSLDDPGAPAQRFAWLRQILPALLVALAIRMVVVIAVYRTLPDADKHYEAFGWEMGWIARALASGHGFSSPYYAWSGSTAMQPPLYPVLLSLVFRLFGIYTLTSAFVILCINSVLSTLTCIPVYFSAKYSLGSRAAGVAAWVWALYPFAIYFSACRVWEYSLTCLLFTTCFCVTQRIHRSGSPLAWLGWGALFGVTALSNPAVLSTLPFLLALALYNAHRSGRRWIANGALTLLAAIAVLTPWTVRNYRALGVLVPVRDNFWLEIYIDNFGNAYLDHSSPPTAGDRGYPADSPATLNKYLTMGETAFLAEKHALAMYDLRHNPRFGFIALKTLRRVVYYWTGYWSFSAAELRDQPATPGQVFYVSSVTFFMLFGIVSLWRSNRAACLPYLVLLGFFPLTYYITHPLLDYRQPLEPAVIVFAVAGALSLFRAEARGFVGAETRLPAEAD